MGLETGTLLTIGSIAMSGVSTFVQARQAQQQAAAQAAAAARTNRFRQAELTRQQQEANRVAREQKSDTIRRADQTLGAIRVAAPSVGASPASTARAFVEAGAAEGRDLTRVERNREEKIAQLQASKRSSQVAFNNTVQQAENQSRSALVGSVLGFGSSALQIGASHHARQERLDALRNKR